jgi:hypothetical protein
MGYTVFGRVILREGGFKSFQTPAVEPPGPPPTLDWSTATIAETKILPSDIPAGEKYGQAVAISKDGLTMAFGSLGYTHNYVYVYVNTGGTWTLQQKVLGSDITAYEYYGFALDISDDGNTLVVGAYGETTGGGEKGAAYVFTRTEGVWTQEAKLTGIDTGANDNNGRSVAISGDGNTIMIGATRDENFTGSVYVFYKSSGVWSQQTKLNPGSGSTGDTKGYAVSLSYNGNTAVFSLPFKDSPTDSGKVEIFTRTGSTWSLQQEILPPVPVASLNFGISVSLDNSGNTLLIGTQNENGSRGAVYVFKRNAGVWSQDQKLTVSDVNSYFFGWSAAISSNSETIAVGAYYADDVKGAVFVFNYDGTDWVLTKKLSASDAAVNDQFGYDVSISDNGNTILVGANEDDNAQGSNAGAVYIYKAT